MKLHAHRAGLPGKVISFYIVPLDPAYRAGAGRGHVPVKLVKYLPFSFLFLLFLRLRGYGIPVVGKRKSYEGLIKNSQYGNSIYQKELSMPRAGTLGKITKEIEKLSQKDQLKLVERLAQQLRRSGIRLKRELDWKGLYGLGKGLWKGEDAQEYVNRMREDRL